MKKSTPKKSIAQKNTAARILDVAERLVQTQGYNGFSYADIAAKLRIQKASLHHHFATKAALGTALVDRYHEQFLQALHSIDATVPEPLTKLRQYAGLYVDVLKNNRLCLCGMLAAEYATLPGSMRDSVTRFFDANDTWLSKVLETGRQRKTLQFQGAPLETARFIVSSLEGAMLLARSYGDVGRFEGAVRGVLGTVSGRSNN